MKARNLDMQNYEIEYGTVNGYAAVVYAKSFISPFWDSKAISEDLRSKLKPGDMVLFDLLLANGDNFNRFGEVRYAGHEILPKDIRLIPRESMPPETVQALNRHYRGRTDMLSRSVLTASERRKFAATK